MITALDKVKQERIYGFPLWMFFIITAFLMLLALRGILSANMIGALAFTIFWGGTLGYIGDRIPIWKHIGGGMLLTCLLTGALYTFEILPSEFIKSLSGFTYAVGFLDFYILILITGSVISVDRKLLIKSFAAYIPVILLSITCSFIFGGLVGLAVGKGSIIAIMDFAFPIMGGGNGAGAIPMSRMWGEVTGRDSQVWYASALAILGVANIFAIFLASIFNRLGEIRPGLTGNGRLMLHDKDVQDIAAEQNPAVKINAGHYASGLALGLFCYLFANFYANNISLINKAGLGFSIHSFAFMIILVIILNISGIIPAEIREGAKALQGFFGSYMTLPLMVLIGIGTNLYDFVNVFSFANLAIIIAVVVGAVVGSYLGSKLFKLYPIDGVITAGLCMVSCGGTGDVQVLGTSKRMELMPYAQISSRIGGAIMLVIASIMFGKFL